jgi:hypothetical protein
VTKPGVQAREQVRVKLLLQDQEVSVFAESHDRIAKERSMRRLLKRLWWRLREISEMKRLPRDDVLMSLGAARQKAPAAWRLVTLEVAVDGASFGFWLNRAKLREVRRREGRCLLRTNLTQADPAKLCQHYLKRVAVEETFRTLKSDLAIRPIDHQLEHRIDAHIPISCQACCLHVTLGFRLKSLASGLSAQRAGEARRRADDRRPRAHHRWARARARALTQPEPEQAPSWRKLRITLPPQPPPKVNRAGLRRQRVVVKT